MELIQQLHAIVTGSRKYGVPREDSDLDVVVFLEGADVRLLGQVADKTPQGFTDDGVEYDSRFGWPFRFGNLNLIVCTKPEQWQVWQEGTASLHFMAKHQGAVIDREKAAATFQVIANTKSTLIPTA